MRPVVLAMFVSLDGYINGPAGAFAGPPFSPDLKTHWIDRNMQRSDVMMYGRVCYEGMEQYWTSQHDDPQAKDLADREKLVFSNTLTEAKWGRVRIVRDAEGATRQGHRTHRRRWHRQHLPQAGPRRRVEPARHADLVGRWDAPLSGHRAASIETD